MHYRRSTTYCCCVRRHFNAYTLILRCGIFPCFGLDPFQNIPVYSENSSVLFIHLMVKPPALWPSILKMRGPNSALLTLPSPPKGGEGARKGTIFLLLMAPPPCGGMAVCSENAAGRRLAPLTLTLSPEWRRGGLEWRRFRLSDCVPTK